MALTLTLAACNTNPSLNGPDGSDLPSTLDDQIRLALSFIAQLRDGAGTPVGMCVPFASGTAAPGWIKANGALVSRTTYAALFAYAASQLVTEADWFASSSGRFSVGDGSTTFRLPDTRGIFIRGLDESRGLDAGRVLGTFQDQANAAHNHGVNDSGHAHSSNSHQHTGATGAAGDHQHSYTSSTPTAAGAGIGSTTVYAQAGSTTSVNGNHSHNFITDPSTVTINSAPTGISIQSSGSEGHPRNLAWPMYIKY